jgi:hypothetical protein
MIEVVSIPINSGAPVPTAMVTDINKTYTVRFYGVADCQTEWADPKGLVDAIWWHWEGGEWVYGGPSTEYQVYLKWNGAQLPPRPRSPKHEYIFTGVPGTGSWWEFKFIDPDYANNSGTLYVEISDGLPESDNPSEEKCSLGAHAGRLGR